MLKKILICALLVLLVVAAAVPMVSLSGKLDKITVNESDIDGGVSDDVTTPDSNEPEGEEPDTDAEAIYGYQITFNSNFFNDLEEIGMVVRVDGKEITEAPSGYIMRGSVIELIGERETTYKVTEWSGDDFTVYIPEDMSVFYESLNEFQTPVALVLHGDITLSQITVK